MLCSALKLVPGCGQPMEHLNNSVIAQLPQQVRDHIQEAYFPTFYAAHAQKGQAFGTKMHFDQFANVFAQKGVVTALGEQVLQSFDRLIMMTRRDRILQAFSYLKAQQTQIWASMDVRHANQADYQFDPEQSAQVTGMIHDFQLQENAWRSICSRLGLSYLEICYEDLAEDPLTVLGNVHDWLEFPRQSVKAPVTVKLSNPTSLKAKAAYLQTIGA